MTGDTNGGMATPAPRATGNVRGQIHAGMEVYGANGGMVGHVKEVRSADMWIDRSLQRDVYVPFDAVQDVVNGQVFLNVLTGHVGDMGWDRPTITGHD